MNGFPEIRVVKFVKNKSVNMFYINEFCKRCQVCSYNYVFVVKNNKNEALPGVEPGS